MQIIKRSSNFTVDTFQVPFIIPSQYNKFLPVSSRDFVESLDHQGADAYGPQTTLDEEGEEASQ